MKTYFVSYTMSIKGAVAPGFSNCHVNIEEFPTTTEGITILENRLLSSLPKERNVKALCILYYKEVKS